MLELTRHKNWQRDLTVYLRSVAGRRGEIGIHDCVIFASGAVHAMTGWRPDPSVFSYRSLAEGYRVLREMGYEDLSAFLDNHFAVQSGSFARAGDLALVRSDDGDALGIMQGEMVYVAGPRGLGLYSVDHITRSWRVG